MSESLIEHTFHATVSTDQAKGCVEQTIKVNNFRVITLNKSTTLFLQILFGGIKVVLPIITCYLFNDGHLQSFA